MNNIRNSEAIAQQQEAIEKIRANIIKIIQTRFKQAPEKVIQTINSIDDKSLLDKLFTNAIIVADLEDFQKTLKSAISKK